MSSLRDVGLSILQFYATAPYSCSYLPGQRARSQVAIPGELVDQKMYSQLVRAGFRRSGLFTYRPHCDRCCACIPVRVRVADYVPGRSHRRVWARQANLRAIPMSLQYVEEHYQLYRAYQLQRHAGGGMDEDDREQYRNFLLKSQVRSFLVEFRNPEQQLHMVSLVDELDDGLSAVYTFYQPDVRSASFGTFAVLWQIELCRQLGLPYLYLGYWIEHSQKMSYKSRYQPLEGLVDGQWQSVPF